MKTINLIALIILALGLSCNQAGKKETGQAAESEDAKAETEMAAHNTLTSEEVQDGWVLLFDGKTTDGWKNWNEDTVTGWVVEEGCLVGLGLGGDIGGVKSGGLC